jgi:hypothetical protein
VRAEKKTADIDVEALLWWHSFEVLGSFWFGRPRGADYGLGNVNGDINDGFIKENAGTILVALGSKSVGLYNAGRNTRFGFVTNPSGADEHGRPTSQLNAFKTTADMDPLEFMFELYSNGLFVNINKLSAGKSITTSERVRSAALGNQASHTDIDAIDLNNIKARLLPGKVVEINSDELRRINKDRALSNNLGWMIFKHAESSGSALQKLAQSSGKPVVLVVP